jgi:FtsP/CotA-like multicopper oxidase with cupredoxin domain
MLGWRSFACLVVALLVAAGAFAASRHSPGRLRTYYIAADEVLWDYAPSGRDEMMGHALDSAEFAIGNGPARQARVFRKAVYREYTDSTFRVRRHRGAEWEHLGLLGPTLHAEVGDTLRVVFRNHARYPFSIHPHGVLYTKSAEGAPYNDDTRGSDRLDDAVPPGGTYVYNWPIPGRAGPGPQDPSTIMWPYHSHAHEWRDVNAGLIGAIVVGRRGSLDATDRPHGVDRELVSLFGVFDETNSRYAPDNLRTYTGDTARVGPRGPLSFSGAGMQSINGYMFGNLPLASLTVRRGAHVRWYVFSGTMADDFHSPHWHGATLLLDGHRTDVVNIAASLLSATADMDADVSGVWMLHCHVAEHMQSGMSARFVVRDPE